MAKKKVEAVKAWAVVDFDDPTVINSITLGNKPVIVNFYKDVFKVIAVKITPIPKHKEGRR